MIIYDYIIMYNYIWAIFSYFLNLTFCKENNAEVILLIIFCVLIIILLFFLYQSNVTKQKIYGHILGVQKRWVENSWSGDAKISGKC